METATARMSERKAFTVLKYSFLPARVRLPGSGANRPLAAPETQSAFHPRAQRNAFRRRGARLQSRSFEPPNQGLTHSPNSNRLC
jgi:hypothetical protein